MSSALLIFRQAFAGVKLLICFFDSLLNHPQKYIIILIYQNIFYFFLKIFFNVLFCNVL